MTTPLLQLIEPRRPAVPARPGFALWALAFRPLYLLASVYATLAVPVWALQFAGVLPGLRAPAWHAHEMLFGFTLAIIVGFLFTAGRNWSGQPTPTGAALAGLCALWVAGRVLAYTPGSLAAVASVAVGVAFALGSAWALFKALRAGGNRRNFFFCAVLVAMAVAQGLLQATLHGWLAVSPALGLQLGLDAVLFVMAVMGGRVIPMFSNNGAPGTDAQRHPLAERLALGSVLALAGVDLLAQAVAPALGLPAAVPAWLQGVALPLVLAVAAASHAWRLWLWHPWRTRRAPLVWVLHAAYAWIPVHLGLRAAAALGWVASGPATHALTAGAIGLLTLGMMTRTARGHLGRPLRAGRAEVAMYALVLAGALLRVLLPLAWPAATVVAATASGLLWSAGFGLYAWRYGPWLWQTRADGRPG